MKKRPTILAFAGVMASAMLALGAAEVALAAPGHGLGHNPNGAPPIGKPASNGDTDRGHSEGKGHNDRAGTTHVIGVVRTISGHVVTVSLPSGGVRTFQLTPVQAAAVRTNEHIVISMGGVLVTKVEPADVVLHGVVTDVDREKTTVTVRLPNGKLRTITVAPEAAENMLHRNGRPVIVSTHTAFTTPATIQVIVRP